MKGNRGIGFWGINYRLWVEEIIYQAHRNLLSVLVIYY